jgi:hypothetical protein
VRRVTGTIEESIWEAFRDRTSRNLYKRRVNGGHHNRIEGKLYHNLTSIGAIVT